jgi:hypothetical protein
MSQFLLWQAFETKHIRLEGEPNFATEVMSRDENYWISIQINGRIPEDAVLPDRDIISKILKSRGKLEGSDEIHHFSDDGGRGVAGVVRGHPWKYAAAPVSY